jgi:hypothetical protein
LDLVFSPSGSIYFGSRVCFLKHFLMPIFFILLICFDICSNKLFFYIKKFVSLFEFIYRSSSIFFPNNFIIYLIREFLLWNMNLVCNTYLFFYKNKKNMYFLFSIQISLVYSLMPESGILYVFLLHNIYQHQTCKYP